MAREAGGLGVVSLYDVEGVTLIVLKYSYEGIVFKGGGSDKTLVGCIGNRVNEVVYGFVDLFRGEVGRGGARESIKLVISERTLLLVMPPSEEVAGAGNVGNIR